MNRFLGAAYYLLLSGPDGSTNLTLSLTLPTFGCPHLLL